MRKAKKSNSDPFIALLIFRNTPQQVTDYSPVQQLINRRTRTLLHMKSSLLESNIPENVQENIQRSKEKQSKYHNRNARFLQELNRGDTVRITPQQGNKAWEKGVVKNKHSERSFEYGLNCSFVFRKYFRFCLIKRLFSCTSYDLSLCLFFTTPFSHALFPCCGVIRTVSPRLSSCRNLAFRLWYFDCFSK
jgi:hypothetical protein